MGAQTRSPAVVANDAGIGTQAWANPDRATVADGSYSTVALTPGAGGSKYLKATGFGFSIPENATIDKVKVEVLRKTTMFTGMNVWETAVLLVKDNVPAGNNLAYTEDPWEPDEFYMPYGDYGDWGVTLTPADINGSQFGVALAVMTNAYSGSHTAFVNHIRITVSYH